MATSIEESISQREKLENQYDRTVREEIETFRTKAISFLAGDITENDFRPFRLKHGIYGQRQPGVQMVRCKIPGGLLTAPQVNQLAFLACVLALAKAISDFFFASLVVRSASARAPVRVFSASDRADVIARSACSWAAVSMRSACSRASARALSASA